MEYANDSAMARWVMKFKCVEDTYFEKDDTDEI